MAKNRDMKTWVLLTLTIVTTSLALFSGISIINPDMLQAHGGITLDPDNAANSIIVHTQREGEYEIRTYDSFSRIGFVSGEGNFLLESVPSLDKKEFYQFIKDSLDDKNPLKKEQINISIDIYSGNGKLIETLEYDKCSLGEYFVHAVDSLGKIQFIEGKDNIEIREVTKFFCQSFTLSLDRFGKNLNEEIVFEKPDIEPNEGDLQYNSMTNTLQRYEDGQWVDISGKGGPKIQR
ncbi:hypothetical protein NsoK4_02095 [Nitrosopumilus sp. K4]|uniref:hypothetical protein n=1 Tax=Nitrosopumilus sp. K4 TaxID=2795383 RepID=UPI001BA97B97|nr:hypothetical protein [Nitrosopumilus sp. K4]QUC65082.1 hypothetical protein NsoK4_02095 [Nitrosopumilus sp. K4]